MPLPVLPLFENTPSDVRFDACDRLETKRNAHARLNTWRGKRHDNWTDVILRNQGNARRDLCATTSFVAGVGIERDNSEFFEGSDSLSPS